MQRYNKDKRAIYKTRIYKKRIYKREACKAANTSRVRYDGYNRIEYMPIIYGKTRSNKQQSYVNMTNAINEIFPEINAPHNAHIYRGTAPYRKFIVSPPEIPRTAPENMMSEHVRIHKNTKRAKCIIYNDEDKIIYIGIIRRTIETDEKHIKITLHRADRNIQVQPYIPRTDKIHGVTLNEIYRHNVEIYHI